MMQAHRNNIGFLRLVFASLVIIGHAPEMTDGNRLREPLTAVFHTISLGRLSVDAFFLLSGYLITRSMIRSSSVWRFLERRILRIYPAFVVAYLACVFVLGPLVGADPLYRLPRALLNVLLLSPPMDYPGQLQGVPHYPVLNGAMWTIGHEFRCYLLVALSGVTGLLARRRLVAALTLVLIAGSAAATFAPVEAALVELGRHKAVILATGDPVAMLRLTAAFAVGAVFCLYEREVAFLLRPVVAGVATLATAALLYRNPHGAETALITLGAIPLFWAAFHADLGPLQRVNDEWDISYGLYLYGWPVAIAILWLMPTMSPWTLAALALPVSLGLGGASWWGLEKHAKDWVRPRTGRAASLSEHG